MATKNKLLAITPEQKAWLQSVLEGESMNLPQFFALAVGAYLEKHPELKDKYGGYPPRVYKAVYNRPKKEV